MKQGRRTIEIPRKIVLAVIVLVTAMAMPGPGSSRALAQVDATPVTDTSGEAASASFSLADGPVGSPAADLSAGMQNRHLDDADQATPVLASPVAPTVTPAVCADGTYTPPSVTFQASEGIIFADVPPLSPNVWYDFRATLEDGYAWDLPLANGWTLESDGSAKFGIEFEAPVCPTMSPEAPMVTQAQCENGFITAPTVTFPDTTGVTYSINDELQPGTLYSYVATLQPYYRWASTFPPGWALQPNGTATIQVYIDDVDCNSTPEPPAPTTPGTLTITQAACVGAGVEMSPSITFPETFGITYVPSIPEHGIAYEPGETAVVTAYAAIGLVLTDTLPTGWTGVDATTATFTVTFDEISCSGEEEPAPTPAEPPPSSMPPPASRPDDPASSGDVNETAERPLGEAAPGQRAEAVTALPNTGTTSAPSASSPATPLLLMSLLLTTLAIGLRVSSRGKA